MRWITKDFFGGMGFDDFFCRDWNIKTFSVQSGENHFGKYYQILLIFENGEQIEDLISIQSVELVDEDIAKCVFAESIWQMLEKIYGKERLEE